VIRGVGVASDGRGVGVMAPRVEGEELALRRAYTEAWRRRPRDGRADRGARHGHAGRRRVEIDALTSVFGERDGELPRVRRRARSSR
jgi:hypothetical protein